MDNTREKLIEVKEALGMCYKQGLTSECTGCTYREHNNVCMDALMEDALAVIKCLEKKQATSNESKWIPVTERLPGEDGKYLVFEQICGRTCTAVLWFAKDARKVDKYDFKDRWKNAWYEYDSEWGHYTVNSVTHWMPLPEPPKGD